jgi:hypothetical protein
MAVAMAVAVVVSMKIAKQAFTMAVDLVLVLISLVLVKNSVKKAPVKGRIDLAHLKIGVRVLSRV